MTFTDRIRPVEQLAADKPHGNRIRYMSGCRCVPCRAANSSYETMRAAARRRGEWNGLVPVERTVRHIRKLAKLGVGYKQVADAAGLSSTTVSYYLRGRRKFIRAMNEKAILAVDAWAIADGALVPAAMTWRRLNWLLRNGFTKSELARRLGSAAITPMLQIRRKFCLAATELKVEKFYNMIRAGDEDFEADAANRWVLPFLDGADDEPEGVGNILKRLGK